MSDSYQAGGSGGGTGGAATTLNLLSTVTQVQSINTLSSITQIASLSTITSLPLVSIDTISLPLTTVQIRGGASGSVADVMSVLEGQPSTSRRRLAVDFPSSNRLTAVTSINTVSTITQQGAIQGVDIITLLTVPVNVLSGGIGEAPLAQLVGLSTDAATQITQKLDPSGFVILANSLNLVSTIGSISGTVAISGVIASTNFLSTLGGISNVVATSGAIASVNFLSTLGGISSVIATSLNALSAVSSINALSSVTQIATLSTLTQGNLSAVAVVSALLSVNALSTITQIATLSTITQGTLSTVNTLSVLLSQNVLSTITQIATLSTLTQGSLSAVAVVSAILSINALSTVTSIVTPIRNFHGNKKTYAAAFSVLAGASVTGAFQVVNIWHSATVAARVQLARILVSQRAGGAGSGRLQVTRITSAPVGSSLVIQAMDQADPATSVTALFSITTSGALATTPIVEIDLSPTTSTLNVDLLDPGGGGALHEGKPPTLRANTAEGYALVQQVDSALAASVTLIINCIWTEE